MAIVIAGPTASGKSRLALALAERRDGVIINADAMQVYRDLRVLTARPTPADEARAPHALYGHVDAATAHAVARFVSEAATAIADARRVGRVPIVVGGTGLYLAALTEGLAAVPHVPSAVRERWREAQARAGAAALHAELARRDPAMAARLQPTDPQRVVRALEVVDGTGRSLSAWQEDRGPAVLPLGADVVALVLTPDRTSIRAAIAARVDAMIQAGALDEASALAGRDLDSRLPAMKAIGVALLAAAAAGRTPLAEAVERVVTQTRQYAKRQDTWFRHRFAHWRRAATPEEAEALH
ncbi:tRNA (adenosine(37)-N6)-dimethylallyltransferase MiaA [Acuticoccus sp.]|uniref:tRNA (adenosine(37)-N6)-dimethylallyltransferase MiaA n=1 Tax=Acuticoccus sp. TaxID=1904378 RepID=UPI003B52E579